MRGTPPAGRSPPRRRPASSLAKHRPLEKLFGSGLNRTQLGCESLQMRKKNRSILSQLCLYVVPLARRYLRPLLFCTTAGGGRRLELLVPTSY